MYEPTDAFASPRYSGPRTFARLPHVEAPFEGVDVAIFGMPWDSGTSFRSGARFGPEAVRSASALLRPYNPAQDQMVFGHVSCVDAGDAPTVPGYIEDTLERIDSFAAALHAAGALPLGIEPERMAKSLVVDVDGSHVFALVPAGRTLSLRELARVAGGRSAALAQERDAERLTGYLVGGISPFGARRSLPVYAEEAWLGHERVALNAGRRGAIVELASADLRRLLEPVVAVISTPV